MTDNVTKAISAALHDHSAAVKHVARWTDTLTASIHGAVTEHIASKMFLSEGMRIRIASTSSELANELVDVILPKFIYDKTKAASMDVTVYAKMLDQPLLERMAKRYSEACIRALDPQIRKHLEAQDRHFAAQPSGKEVVPLIDLGAYAADRNAQFALEDARKAAPAAAPPVEFHEEDELSAIERTASAQSKYPAKRSKR